MELEAKIRPILCKYWRSSACLTLRQTYNAIGKLKHVVIGDYSSDNQHVPHDVSLLNGNARPPFVSEPCRNMVVWNSHAPASLKPKMAKLPAPTRALLTYMSPLCLL